MRGLMQHDELVLTRILERAATFHPRQQIVTKSATGIERESYEDMAERAARLAGALGIENMSHFDGIVLAELRHDHAVLLIQSKLKQLIGAAARFLLAHALRSDGPSHL